MTENGDLVKQVSALIKEAQVITARQANATMTLRNWYIGHLLDVDVLAHDRADYGKQIVATLSQQLSWSHLITLLPLPTDRARAFYIEQAISARLSVRALRDLISRQGFERNEIAKAQTPGGSVVPRDTFRDPYFLDFPGLQEAYTERDVEQAIIRDMESFLLEVGNGWTFVARQKRMTVGNDDFALDLLFYSRPLQRLIAVELKLGKFKPSYKGQMELDLKWLNRYERREHELAPIGSSCVLKPAVSNWPGVKILRQSYYEPAFRSHSVLTGSRHRKSQPAATACT